MSGISSCGFLRELRQSTRLNYDLDIYDGAREGSEQHTYAFPKNSIKGLLTRERKRKTRDRIARSHGDKYMVLLHHPALPAPQEEVAARNRKALEVQGQEPPEEVGRSFQVPTSRDP